MKITRLKVENVKRIKVAEIFPEGPITRIAGRNAQGKSSLLDSIAMSLGGKAACPEVPIRDGEEYGSITLETDAGHRVHREFYATGSQRLTVQIKGKVQKGPQSLLDALVGSGGLDPQEFLRKRPREQAEALREVTGLDFAPLDKKRSSAYDTRAHFNGEVKRLKALLASLPARTPAIEKVDVSALIAEQVEGAKVATDARLLGNAIEGRREHLGRVEREVARVRAEIEALGNRLFDLQEEEERHHAAIQHMVAEHARIEVPDLAPIALKLQNAEAINAQARNNAELDVVESDLLDAEQEQSYYDTEIHDLDAAKAELLASAKLPVEGLSFTEAGITLKGLPFDQASQAERWRVAIAVALHASPSLRVVLVREGSLLDEDAQAMVATLADELGGQVLFECVGLQDDSIIIEDGEVVSLEQAQAREALRKKGKAAK